jgi:hypothetical protein
MRWKRSGDQQPEDESAEDREKGLSARVAHGTAIEERP